MLPVDRWRVVYPPNRRWRKAHAQATSSPHRQMQINALGAPRKRCRAHRPSRPPWVRGVASVHVQRGASSMQSYCVPRHADFSLSRRCRARAPIPWAIASRVSRCENPCPGARLSKPAEFEPDFSNAWLEKPGHRSFCRASGDRSASSLHYVQSRPACRALETS